MKHSVDRIQQELRRQGLDGWLLFVFRTTNPVADSLLGLPSTGVRTRRCFYWIPASGEPGRLQHRIESTTLAHLPGTVREYLSYQSLRQELDALLTGATRIAMEYSPMGAIPTVSWVDGGTLDLVRDLGKTVVSSAELIQFFEATLTPEQESSHLEAAAQLRDIAFAAFQETAKACATGKPLSEYDLQQWIMSRFAVQGLNTDHPPIVGINGNAGNPHYEPAAHGSARITEDCLLLIDLWAKCDRPGAVYADQTWMGWTGPRTPPERVTQLWEVVRDARDAALALVRERWAAKAPVHGWEVDQAARDVITAAGLGDHFIHRTGHSMHTVDHASGANMDNLESKELRPLIPGTLFSIEPGIYLPDLGYRSEINVLLSAEGEVVVAEGTLQRELFRWLPPTH